MGHYSAAISTQLFQRFLQGIVIPAHPLALNAERQFDERSQRALTRYYHAAGAEGLAVGVHTTQFAIRNPQHGLLNPVLELVAETARACDERTERETMLIAGIVGDQLQALTEAGLAHDAGYHAGLLSFSALPNATERELLELAGSVAERIPLLGFYLQTAVGGRHLSRDFWREFCLIENVVGIKIAPFNRYATLDVVHGLVQSGRADSIVLYTGNDDSILHDLLTEYEIPTSEGTTLVRIKGGLLGHWAVWTRQAVKHLEQCKEWRASGTIPAEALTLAAQITDSNGAFFDAAHNYAGSIAGIHEVLRRQGLLQNNFCLDPNETLSSGQAEEIDRIYAWYPHLNDDDFVREHIDEWR